MEVSVVLFVGGRSRIFVPVFSSVEGGKLPRPPHSTPLFRGGFPHGFDFLGWIGGPRSEERPVERETSGVLVRRILLSFGTGRYHTPL